MSPFARFFRNLPKNVNEMILKPALIPLNDIECLTTTVIDIPEGVQNLNYRKREHGPIEAYKYLLMVVIDALALAQDQFKPLCSSWNYNDWDEFDYSKIKNLQFREIEDKRKKEGLIATERECLKCPNFLKHVSIRVCLFGLANL
jgi:antiviral helicase SKI2